MIRMDKYGVYKVLNEGDSHVGLANIVGAVHLYLYVGPLVTRGNIRI